MDIDLKNETQGSYTDVTAIELQPSTSDEVIDNISTRDDSIRNDSTELFLTCPQSNLNSTDTDMGTEEDDANCHSKMSSQESICSLLTPCGPSYKIYTRGPWGGVKNTPPPKKSYFWTVWND